MKYLQLQNDILKASAKRDRGGKRSPFMYGQTARSVGIIFDGHYIVFIREHEFYLDLKKVFKEMTPVDLKKIMVEDPEDALPAYDTGVTRTVEYGHKVRIFSTNKADIWIDETCLKYFDLSNATFKGTEKNKPLYIYEADPFNELVGFVLPVNHS